jgi:Domain of unknown function (DUF4430)
VRALPAHLLAVACLIGLTGCGLGAGSAPRAVRLVVTRDFGARVLRQSANPHVRGEETVMSLLLRNYSVSTRFGGGFVQAIAGSHGGQAAGRPVDWFYYVNGVQAAKGAAATNVHPGDHIWWDLHDWSQTDDVPAVVGSFPEPFLNGLGGKRLPVRVECAQAGGPACDTVTARLRAAGVPAATSAIGSGGGPAILRVLVGPWAAVRADRDVDGIETGPRSSGVYAIFRRDGSSLTLLDQDGHRVRTLGSGAGLIAATRLGEDAPTWVVTGTDGAGVELAAHAFGEAALSNRFALALAPGQAIALPEAGG